ncbi:MAG: hypothetical protein LWX70_06620, partial [Sphingobacteriia bacterium]|nr:hypothetical protein [Sphingobacteriia bacterium]
EGNRRGTGEELEYSGFDNAQPPGFDNAQPPGRCLSEVEGKEVRKVEMTSCLLYFFCVEYFTRTFV